MSSEFVPDKFAEDLDLVALAREQHALLPERLRQQVEAFRIRPPAAGCMLLQGLPVDDLPPTPASPTAPTTKTLATELRLLTFATLLGEPVGYLPEHGGDIVQNIVPVESSAAQQTSTSSSVDLMLHTEAAFHPHRPRFLLLYCLRGDPSARTTVSSVVPAMASLDAGTVEVLFQPRFRCAVDESHLHGRTNVLGPPMPVLSGDRQRPAMVFDHDLMVGTDEQAEDALAILGDALSDHRQTVALEAGDLLIIDNAMVVHGRSPFASRFDGTDRWLQRAFVVTDLAASDGERAGRVITTVFGE